MAKRRKSSGLDGVINLDKPSGVSSARALYRVRGITGQPKSGHAGTLDPLATGVLVLCLGRATKLVERIMDQPKVYRALARLDVTSESFDAGRAFEPVEVATVPTADAVTSACHSFEGLIEQVPPSVSAIKVGGRPAYDWARAGRPITLEARPVHVYWIQVHRYEWPELDFEVCCGRGTYIRSLIRDIGQRLGTGGCLTSLARTRVGRLTQGDGWTIERLERAHDTGEYVIDMDHTQAMLAAGTAEVPPRSVDGKPHVI